ncbi:MAG: lptA [Burkholderiaceae bacterium]|nr:lptA [Burkholderiaceae bacterium]
MRYDTQRNPQQYPTMRNPARNLMLPALLLLALTLGLLTSNGARAEKADANQPTHIEADHMDYDDLKQVNTFTGNVKLVRGTLTIRGQKMVITQDASGYQLGTVYGSPAHFRQKRDGGPNLWTEGQGERIEHDSKTEITKFFTRAKMKRLEGTKVTDEVHGEFISYDARKEFYSVNNTASGQSKPGAGRVKVVLQPREDKKKSADGKNKGQ